VEKYCTAGQATDNNVAHAHCMLHNYGYTHAHSITFCFFTATVDVMLCYTCIACLVSFVGH